MHHILMYRMVANLGTYLNRGRVKRFKLTGVTTSIPGTVVFEVVEEGIPRDVVESTADVGR